MSKKKQVEGLNGNQMFERFIYTIFCIMTFGTLYLLRLAVTIGVEKSRK